MNFQVNNLLANKHIQTVYTTFFKKTLLKNFEIEEFKLSDGDFIEIYWYNKRSNPNKIAVLFHGLAGSYKSPYIQGAVDELSKKGFTCAVVHFRGCAAKENLKARSYHSGETKDNLEFLKNIHKKNQNTKIFCVGYSLGANMLLKLLGELKQNSFITSAVAVSAPMQLDIAANSINKGLAKIYQRRLLNDLKASLLKKFDKFDFKKLINLTKKDLKNIKTIKEFDELYTAPINGFLSADDYYKKCSAKQFLKDIYTPTLIIHSKDDPFMDKKIIPNNNEISEYITLEISENGGHVGFINGTFFKPNYWLEKRIVEFFELFT